MGDQRTSEDIFGELEAFQASGQKNPRKVAKLKNQGIHALQGEKKAALAKIRLLEKGLPAAAAESSPAKVEHPDWQPLGVIEQSAHGPDHVDTDAQLLSRILSRYAVDSKSDQPPVILWNAARRALNIRREALTRCGIGIPGEPLFLPGWGKMNLDNNFKPKDAPKPAPTGNVVKAETQIEQAARERQEAEAREQRAAATLAEAKAEAEIKTELPPPADADDDVDVRIAQALEDRGRGQLTEKTDAQVEREKEEAFLAKAGAGAADFEL